MGDTPFILAMKLPDKPKNKRLTDSEVKIISYIEQKFWETGNIATDEVVSLHTNSPLAHVRKCWKNPVFREALQARGINFSQDEDVAVLTPVQLMLANMLLNSHDKTSIRQKLQVLNVSSQQYHGWMRQPAFQSYIRKRAEEQFKSADPDAYMGLVKAVQQGDLRAIQLFFEMRGIYNPKVEVNVNIEVVLTKVVEIISRHVKDESTLNAIAVEFDSLMAS